MPLDYNILNKGVSLLDNQRLQQDFELKKQAAIMENATKSNALKYQTIAAGAANGANGLSIAKQRLNQLGIDASEYSDDPAQAAQQALAAQQATSPYGTLFNAQQKVIGNNIAAANAFGDTANPYTQPVFTFPGTAPSLGTNTPTKPAANPPAIIPANMGNQQPEPPILDSNPVKPPSLPNPSVIPPRLPNETQAAYDKRLSNDPSVIAAKKEAEAIGAERAKKTTESAASTETYNQLGQNLDALSELSKKIPNQGVFLSPQAQGNLSMRLSALPVVGAQHGGFVGNDKNNNYVSQYNLVADQQVLNTIKQLVSSGQIRGNQFLEKLATQASIAPLEGTTDEGRQQLLGQIRAELKNAGISTSNQAARLNGGASQLYEPLPVSTSQGASTGFKYLGVKK